MNIKQFQELYFISNGKDIDIDKSIKMVGVITGLTPDKVEAMDIDKFNRKCAIIKRNFDIIGQKLNDKKPVKYLFVKHRIYRINYEIGKTLNAGKYVELMTFAKDVIGNLHKIMATICTPINLRGKELHRDHSDIAEDMELVDFSAAYHAAVFFYTLYLASMKITLPSLKQELIKKGASPREVEESLNSLLPILDGFITPKWSLSSRQYLLNRFGI